MITGNTRLYAIIADPVAQVRTPEVLNDYFARNQQDAVLVPIQVAPEGLQDLFAAFRRMKNLGGFVVTVPHKTTAAALCDELGPAGQAIGSVNAIRRTSDGRLVGDMFDGAGFVAGLRAQGRDPADKRVLLVGSGGAASAIAFALAEAAVASLTIANRTASKARDLVARLQPSFPDVAIDVGAADPRGADLVINATSLGMKESDPLPLDIALLSRDTVVAEIIMKPEMTALLEGARSKGCTIHHGHHMLDEQVKLLAGFITANGV